MQNNIPIIILFLNSFLVIDVLILIAAVMALLKRENPSITLWGKWTLVTILGLTAGILVAGIFGMVNSPIIEILGVAVASCIIGFAQWVILRPYLDNSIYWIFATTIGLTSGITLPLVTTDLRSAIYVIGVILGATQLLVIEKQYRKAGWWVVASGIGGAYWSLQTEIYWKSINEFDWKFFVIAEASTFFYSAITGFTLIWILKRTIQNKHKYDTEIKLLTENTH